MTPNANFRMSKSGKITLSRNWDNKNISLIRKSVILAELKSREIVRTKRDKSDDA